MRISSGDNDIQFIGMSGPPLASSSSSPVPLYQAYTPKRKSPSSSSGISLVPPPTKKSKASPPPPAAAADTQTTQAQDDEIFVVERLMARSFYKGVTSTGLREYEYLVRWEGYGPAHDTWEPRSSLMEGAADLLLEFDFRDHPLTIVDRRDTKPETYLVRYSLENQDVPASPHAQTMWHAKGQIAVRRDISSAAIDEAIRHFERGKTGLPTPPVSAKASPPRGVINITNSKPVKKGTARVLLELLDQRKFKRKYNSTNLSSDFLVRYTEGRKTKTEWLSRETMAKWWREESKAMVKQWNDDLAAAGKGDDAAPPTDYDLERLRNIDENRTLLKDLGIAM